MLGSLSTAKKVNLHSIVQSHQFKMLLVSVSIGVISGLFIASLRLSPGLPGHKAFLWMTPVLITRLRNKCKIGTSAGGLATALTTYSLGANLAGGLFGLPIIVIAAASLDWTANFLEKHKISLIGMVLLLGLTGIVANLVCLSKRMLLPTGFNPHSIFGVSGFEFKLCSYMFFGFLSGSFAAVTAKLMERKQRGARK